MNAHRFRLRFCQPVPQPEQQLANLVQAAQDLIDNVLFRINDIGPYNNNAPNIIGDEEGPQL